MTKPTLEPAALIERYIEPSPDRPGPGDARLVYYGVPVWALIGHYRATGRDVARVAASYEVPVEAVRAALSYYQRHRAAIEARLAANTA